MAGGGALVTGVGIDSKCLMPDGVLCLFGSHGFFLIRENP
jgi:hypothetical protein